MIKYIDTTDVAKMIREDLKRSFPDVKFSVKSKKYAGGSSINIRWTDGPTTKQVDSLVSRYEGSTFDPMIDLKSSRYAEDGQGNKIRYMSDYVFCNRDYSEQFLQAVIDYLMKTYAFTDDPIFDVGGTAPYCYIRTRSQSARFGNEYAYSFAGRFVEEIPAVNGVPQFQKYMINIDEHFGDMHTATVDDYYDLVRAQGDFQSEFSQDEDGIYWARPLNTSDDDLWEVGNWDDIDRESILVAVPEEKFKEMNRNAE